MARNLMDMPNITIQEPESGLDIFLREAANTLRDAPAIRRQNAELELARNEQARADEKFQANKKIAMNQESRAQEEFKYQKNQNKKEEYNSEFALFFPDNKTTQEGLDSAESYIESISRENPNIGNDLRNQLNFRKSSYQKKNSETDEIGYRLADAGIIPEYTGSSLERSMVENNRPQLVSQWMYSTQEGSIPIAMQEQAAEDRKMINGIIETLLIQPEAQRQKYMEDILGPSYQGYVNKYNVSMPAIEGMLSGAGISIEKEEDDLDVDDDVDKIDIEDTPLVSQEFGKGAFKRDRLVLEAEGISPKMKRVDQAANRINKISKDILNLEDKVVSPAITVPTALSGFGTLYAGGGQSSKTTQKQRVNERKLKEKQEEVKNLFKNLVDPKTGEIINREYRDEFINSLPERDRSRVLQFIKRLYVEESSKDEQNLFEDNNRPSDAPVNLPDWVFEEATTDSLGNPISPANR